MNKQLMIYERATPVTTERHKDWSVKAGDTFAFARGINAAPLMASELATAAAEYPIVFAGDDDVMPAAILGVRADENMFVGSDGKWIGRYLPAFLRQYPFVFASSPDSTRLTLCLDEAFEGVNQDGRGERLFDSEGSRTAYLDGIVDFSQRYQRDYKITAAFCKLLAENDLLEPMTAQFQAQGQPMSLQGFRVIRRDRLKALKDETVLNLFRIDGLELIYAHLQSLQNFTPMVKRLAAADPADPAGQGG